MVCTPSLTSKVCTTSWILQLRIEPCGWQTFKHNLYPTCKGTKMIQGEFWCPSQGSTKFQGRRPNVVSTTTHKKKLVFQRNWTTKDLVHSPSQTNQWCGLPIQAYRLHENTSSVACFLIRTLSCIRHPNMGFMLKNMDKVYEKGMVFHGEFWLQLNTWNLHWWHHYQPLPKCAFPKFS